MRVDLQIPDSWHKANATYFEALGLGPGAYSVHSYLGVRHALWEICTQLAQLQPNKRTVVYLKESAPVVDPVAVHLSREGFKVRAFTEAEMKSSAAWMEGVQKDLLFVLTEYDDPVTGELFDVLEADEAIKDTRLYRIRVSHSWHTCFKPAIPGAMEVQVLSLAPDRAIALVGDRVRMSPPVSTGLSWPNIEIAEAEASLLQRADIAATKIKVEAFEAALPSGFERALPKDRSRLPDRALCVSRDIDGLALATELAKELGVQLREPGCDSVIETTSLCRWVDERALQGLVTRGFAPEILRGLIIIDAALVSQPDFVEKLKRARIRILALQAGE